MRFHRSMLRAYQKNAQNLFRSARSISRLNRMTNELIAQTLHPRVDYLIDRNFSIELKLSSNNTGIRD